MNQSLEDTLVVRATLELMLDDLPMASDMF